MKKHLLLCQVSIFLDIVNEKIINICICVKGEKYIKNMSSVPKS